MICVSAQPVLTDVSLALSSSRARISKVIKYQAENLPAFSDFLFSNKRSTDDFLISYLRQESAK
jgi:hypothetical protein